MSAPDSSAGGSQEKSISQITVQKGGTSGTYAIDLGEKTVKVAHVKLPTDTLKVASVATAQQAVTAFRTLGGQSPQVRVVMPPGATLMQQAMIKQIDGGSGGVRTQITAIPPRTMSQTSITVTRPVTPTNYLPRTGVTNIQAQRLGTPIRTPTPPTVAGLATNFVRGTTVARNTTSPATTVISPTTATWMTTATGQVQLIRAINQQPRQRIVAQNITSTSGTAGGVVAVGQTATIANVQAQQQQNQGTIQSVTSQPTQQAYVATLATVLPPRQQTATLVYSNIAASSQGGPTQFNPTASGQRFTMASLAGSQRQMRPIQLSNRAFSTAKIGVGGMNTTSISIRAPNIPVLTPTLPAGNTGNTIQARTTTGNVNLSTTSLSTPRIFQLQQQQPGGGTPQIIGSTGRITSNLMLQPITMSAASGGKIGIRQPTTISAKVQPSLTITQLGVGKLSTAQQSTTGSIQGASIIPTSSNSLTTPVSATIVQQQAQQSQSNAQQQQQSVTINTSNTNQQQPITQIVSVNQGLAASTGQIITAQNVNVNVPSSATVVPLAITSRATNVLTGTITPIKSGGASVVTSISVPPIAKVIPQQQQQQHAQQHIQQSGAQLQQQTSQQNVQVSEILTSTQASHQPTSVFIHARPPSSGTSASGASNPTVISNSGTFLPTGGTFYYESVPANSASVSTGVLSLTTTTVTSSISSSQSVTSSNIATGIVTSIPYSPSPGTFAVVPSSNRTIGQIHIPVSSAGSQIVPVRFQQHIPEQTGTSSQSAMNHQQQHQIMAATQQIQQQQQPPPPQVAQQQTHHQIISLPQSQQPSQTVQQTHIMIPVQTSIKIPSASVPASSPRTTGVATATLSALGAGGFLRKRENDGSPIRAAKNLAPTLLSMGTTVIAERAKERPPSPHSRPGSSGGSTTVSANSSPGIDQQMQEEMSSMTPMNSTRISSDSHFNPIDDLYSNHQNSTVSAVSRIQPQPQQLQHQISTGSSNGNLEPAPRKKPRRSTNENQTAAVAQNQQAAGQNHNVPPNSQSGAGQEPKINNNTIASSNKENTKPPEIIIKKPRTYNLLDGYRQSWKAANNHFQRYSDVKPREERRPTVMDLANQAHVVQKINGWKIYHLSAQMEDLCELETQVYEKLGSMLKQLEKHGQTSDIDRVNDLIKGNMQRSKIIVDGVSEARTQIMKIFDHKSHVSDIIHRCASKRNFKKREKT